MSPTIQVRCDGCGTPTTFKREAYGPTSLPCSSCGDPVGGETRATVLGPMPGPGAETIVAHVVCASCAGHCRRCRPFRGGDPKTGRYGGVGTPMMWPENASQRAGEAALARTVASPMVVPGVGLSVTCAACGAPFTAHRSTARYCSPTCRQRAKRAAGDPRVSPERDCVASTRISPAGWTNA